MESGEKKKARYDFLSTNLMLLILSKPREKQVVRCFQSVVACDIKLE
jgi:hypothetical protein